MSREKLPTEVLPFLFIGDRNHAKSKGILMELKIKRVLNVTPSKNVDSKTGCPNFFEKEPSQGIQYRRVPIMDNRGENLLIHLDPSIAFIKAGKYHGGVLVHCHRGVSRSASIVIAYLMKEECMSLNQALSFLKSKRPCINPHEAFLSQLAQFEKQIQDSRRDNDSKSNSSPIRSLKIQKPAASSEDHNQGVNIGPVLPPHFHILNALSIDSPSVAVEKLSQHPTDERIVSEHEESVIDQQLQGVRNISQEPIDANPPINEADNEVCEINDGDSFPHSDVQFTERKRKCGSTGSCDTVEATAKTQKISP